MATELKDTFVGHREQYHDAKVVSYSGYGHGVGLNRILSTLRRECND